MTNEELNTALYKKMFAEQEAYRDWLLEQPPKEILEHAHEYVMREDILISLEENDLTDEQADALLQSETPLGDVYRIFEKRDSEHMEEIWRSMERCADEAIDAQCAADNPALQGVPFYPHTDDHAREQGEYELYRASFKSNVACKNALQEAVQEHYHVDGLDASAAVSQVAEKYGMERMMHVLAAAVRWKQRDGSIPQEQKTWAFSMPDPDPSDRLEHYSLRNMRGSLLSQLVTRARQMEREQKPSIWQQLQQKVDATAKKPATCKEPER